ncbi:MAG: hypothetical protein LBP30_03145, partial [Clostridiales Family XIII bacterium]|nr:hypothetical protein [Clostridiales Family XIII bacterium]
MSDLTTLKIKSPYGLLDIETLSFSVRPNEHGILRLTGTLGEGTGFSPLMRSSEGDGVVLTD